jgi:UDP-3-O-[3-hydroxymyristoyl] glucosamine N-acyltransferase
MDFSSYLRVQALSRNLPDLEKRVKELEKMIEQLLAERVNA